MYLNAILNFYNWNGRLNRRQYFVVIILLAICCSFIVTVLNLPFWIAAIFFILIKIPSDIKRLKDIDKDHPVLIGILTNIICFIPIIGILFLIYLHVVLFSVKGIEGINRYSPYKKEKHKSYSYIRASDSFILPNINSQLYLVNLDHLLYELTFLILTVTENNYLFKNKKELMELRYMVLSEIDFYTPHCFRSYYKIIDKEIPSLVLEACTPNGENPQYYLREYYKRLSVYSICDTLVSEQIGMSKNWILGHFIQKVRGKTTGKDISDLLKRERKIKEDDLTEFLDLFENMKVSILLTSIDKTLKDFKNNFLKMHNAE